MYCLQHKLNRLGALYSWGWGVFRLETCKVFNIRETRKSQKQKISITEYLKMLLESPIPTQEIELKMRKKLKGLGKVFFGNNWLEFVVLTIIIQIVC